MAHQNALNTLLEKTSDWDKDERYMACSDLCNELQKDIKIDASLEQRICAAILQRLDDQSNDVQAKAINCLGILLRKVQEAQVFEICEKLCVNILEGKDELRDIYSIGLKTLVADVPEKNGRGVAQILVGRLLIGIENVAEKPIEVKLECMDCLGDLLRRFGREVGEVKDAHENIMRLLMQQLKHDRGVVRKKAIACLGTAAVVLSDPLLNQLVENLLSDIKAASQSEVRTLIQTVGTVSRTVGYRLGRHLDAVVPLFLKFLGDPEDENQQTEAHNELRETCLQGFESFILRCRQEITPHLADIRHSALVFMKYDPNYNYGDESGDDMSEDEEYEDEDGYEEDGMDDEDDDTSWKVRRAAVKVLGAIIVSRPEMLQDLYDSCGSEIIGRFKEREENVRLDIIECFTALVRVTMVYETRKKTIGETIASQAAAAAASSTAGAASRSPAVGLLITMLPAVMAVAIKQLAGRADKTKAAVYAMLKTLCSVVPTSVAEHMNELMPSLMSSLTDKNQSLKLDALAFLRLSVESQATDTFQPHVDGVLPLVLALVREEWYKIIAEALRVVKVFVGVLRPLDGAAGFVDDFNFGPHVGPIYDVVLVRLQATDIDQEIKECAIVAVGQLIAYFGDVLSDKLPVVEKLLMDRLRNEITRMPTLKALVMIAQSPLSIDLTPILEDAINELAQFLRQQSRPLKQTTLETLTALVKSNASQMSGGLFETILAETAPLVSDNDLHLTHLSLRLTIDVLKVSPSATKTLGQCIMPRVLALASSSLLQGRALDSLLQLLRELVEVDAPGLDFDSLYNSIEAKIQPGGDHQKQAVANVAHCLATMCVATSDDKRAVIITRLVQSLNGAEDEQRHLALLTIGELGQHRDLSGVTDLHTIVLNNFSSPSEEIKAAAAYALGRMTVGNMGAYLGIILDSLSQNTGQYLLLSALKEVIVLHANTEGLDFSSHIDQVLPHLLRHCESPEEGVRNMVAECLGALITMHPDVIVPQLTKLGSDASDTFMRWTIASSLKYCMSGRAPHQILATHMPAFLTMLNDEDLSVRHASLSMCNAAVHHQPGLVIDFLRDPIIPVLYETVRLKVERVVDLGPFKQRVDDGLPLRKTALACINTVLDTLPDQMDIGAFLPYLETGLGDQADVQMLCHQILIKICSYAPGAVLTSLDGLVDPLEKTVTKKVKEGSGQVGTEVERANELIRSGLRAVLAIASIPDTAGISRKFWEFLERCQKKEKLAHYIHAIKAEN